MNCEIISNELFICLSSMYWINNYRNNTEPKPRNRTFMYARFFVLWQVTSETNRYLVKSWQKSMFANDSGPKFGDVQLNFKFSTIKMMLDTYFQ